MTVVQVSAAVFILAAIAKAGNVCLSGQSATNSVFLGTYTQDSGNSYYTHTRCDGSVDYLFQRSNKWQVSTDMTSNTFAMRCPSETAQPQDCPAGTWRNGGVVDDTVSVQSGACPSTAPSISCSSIYIDVADKRCSGTFDRVDEGLYRKQCGGSSMYYYFNGYFEAWECGPRDERDVCDAFDNNNLYYFESTDAALDTLSAGNPVTADLNFPAGTQAGFYCDSSPRVNCNYLEFDNVGNGVDGAYQRDANDQHLFVNADEGLYFTYHPVAGSTVSMTDPLSVCSWPSAYFRSSDTAFGELSSGQVDVAIDVTFPSDATSATVSCLSSPPTPQPTEELCVAVPTWLNYGSNNWFMSGKYRPMGEMNGYPAYELYGCESEYGATTKRYMWYLPAKNGYIISTTISGTIYIRFWNTNGAETALDTVWNKASYPEVLASATRPGGCGCDSVPLSGATVPEPLEEFEWKETVGDVDHSGRGIWAQFLQILAHDQMASLLTLVFLVLSASAVAMCAYCLGYARGAGKSNKFEYSKAKAVFDGDDGDDVDEENL